MAAKKNQREVVAKYLSTHKKGITSYEAFEKFNITRLSAVIYDLKHKFGMDIETDTCFVDTQYGRTQYARYRLKKA